MSLFLMVARFSSLSFATYRPFSAYLPESGRSKRPKRFIRVDLPEPERPQMATNSPCITVKETLAIASTIDRPRTYCLLRFLVATTGVVTPETPSEDREIQPAPTNCQPPL